MAPPLVWTPGVQQEIRETLTFAYGAAIAPAPVWPARLLGALDVSTTDSIYVWPQATVGEYQRGPMGDDLTYQSLLWQQRRVSVLAYGIGFTVYQYNLRDYQARMIDPLRVFATQCGKKAGTYNARATSYVLANGTDASKVTAREGGALFRHNHPIGGDSADTFENYFEECEFNMQNLAAVRAYARGIDDGSGDLEAPEAEAFVVVPENFQLRTTQLTDAQMLADQISGIANASSNTYYKGQYGYQEPVVTPYLTAPTEWYVVIPGWGEANEAPVNRAELEGWKLQEFNPGSDLVLAQRESLEVRHTARVAVMGGNPKRIFKCTAGGSAANNSARFNNIRANL